MEKYNLLTSKAQILYINITFPHQKGLLERNNSKTYFYDWHIEKNRNYLFKR